MSQGSKELLPKKNHDIDEYFEYKNTQFIKTKIKNVFNIDQKIICCKDLSGFINQVKNQGDVSDVHLKLDIDGGGGIFAHTKHHWRFGRKFEKCIKRQKFDNYDGKRFQRHRCKKIVHSGHSSFYSIKWWKRICSMEYVK